METDLNRDGEPGEAERPIKDFEVLRTMDGVRALADSTRLRMVQILSRTPSSGSMLARALGIPANRAHYHLKRLLRAGLIQSVGEGPRRVTEERLYEATARHILVDPGLGGVDDRPTIALRQSIDTTFSDWRRSQILGFDWGQLARIVVQRSLRVRNDDHVLILFAPIALELSEALQVEIEACGGTAYLRPWSRNIMLRTLDRYLPNELASVPLVPLSIDRRLTAAVLLTSSVVQGAPPNPTQRELLPIFLRSVSAWKRSVPSRGLRYVHVGLPSRAEFEQGYVTPEAGIEAFWRCVSADLESIHDRGDALLQIIRAEPELMILGKDEAELRITLDPTKASVGDGVISDDDLRAGRSIEAVPAGSFGALPLDGTGDGVFHADYTFSGGVHIPGVRVTLRAGRIVEVEAARDAQLIRDRLAHETGDPGMVSGVTIGLNPGASGLTGKPELDSLLSGVVALHFGNNELWGGQVKSTFNLSLPAHGITVRTRTKRLVSGGRLTRPAVSRRPRERA